MFSAFEFQCTNFAWNFTGNIFLGVIYCELNMIQTALTFANAAVTLLWYLLHIIKNVILTCYKKPLKGLKSDARMHCSYHNYHNCCYFAPKQIVTCVSFIIQALTKFQAKETFLFPCDVTLFFFFFHFLMM